MARNFGVIDSSLWADKDFENEPFEIPAFYAYLCSNSECNLIGLYQTTHTLIRGHTNLFTGAVEMYAQRLENLKKIEREDGFWWIRGMGKRVERNQKLVKRAFQLWSQLPGDLELKKRFSLKYKDLTIAYPKKE